MKPDSRSSTTARAAGSSNIHRAPAESAGSAGADARSETDRVVERYARRRTESRDSVYDPLKPSVFLAIQERDRAIIRWIRTCGIAPVAGKRLIEVGCGSGSNLLRFMQVGFQPENIVANELLDDRAAEARRRLPQAIEVMAGDASQLDIPDASFDVAFQATVFSSILDDGFRQRLASRMWRWVRPGGGVLWYDFVYDNPRNPDVNGISVAQVRALFPEARMRTWRVTLAPPISRSITRLSPALYPLFNMVPLLRTHVLCWLEKPET